MKLSYTVNKNDVGKSINSILKSELNISTRLLNKSIKNEQIFLNNKITNTNNKVSLADTIDIYFDMCEDNSNIVHTKMNLDIIYEDEWMLVINKPSHMPIHPSMAHFTDSLSNGVRFYFDAIGLHKKIRPVNRLDLDTSGVVIFAKCEYIQECLKILKKEYICVVDGILDIKSADITLPIARKENSIIERCIDEKNGVTSITNYEVLQEFKNYSLLKCILKTGRTHQIRVHMAAINHPIIGDTLYGSSSPLITRQALHSYKIECVHPVSKEILYFEAEIPDDIKSLLI